MTNRNHLVEQHILEYESRLKHLDEVVDKAHKTLGTGKENTATSEILESLKSTRPELENHLENLRAQQVDQQNLDADFKAGPLEIWDSVAEKLEQLTEHLDHNRTDS